MEVVKQSFTEEIEQLLSLKKENGLAVSSMITLAIPNKYCF